MRKFDNKEWIDISSEDYREYVGADFIYRIDNPKSLFISKTGTQFVLDGDGVIHTFQKGTFIAMRFFSKEGLTFVEPSLKTVA